MKKNIFLLILLYTINLCAQSSTPINLYKGVWSTVNPNKTTILCNSAASNRIYRIINGTLSADNLFDDYTIIVDGTELPRKFMEGGGVVVEGKRVELRQNGVSMVSVGVWEIIQSPTAEAIASTWAAKPELNKEFLVADLKVAQEFQFSVNSESLGCKQNFIEVAIDGNIVKDSSGRPVNFATSSSFLGEGKRITIKASGACSGNNSFVSGSLLLKKMY